MKKSSLLLAVMVAALLAGCTAGPSYLSRTVDDMQNNNYEKDPLITSILSDVIPVYGFGKFVGGIVDYVVLNPIQFWGWDVWDGEGASHMHTNPAGVRDPWFPRWFDEGGE